MYTLLPRCMVVSALLFVPLPAWAYGLPTQPFVPTALARDATDAAVAACMQRGAKVSAAVVDRYGDLTFATSAMGTAASAPDNARRKASTALSGMSSAQYAERQHTRPGGPGTAVQYHDIILRGGGLPIKKGSDVVAGLGVAGSGNEKTDEDCARAGLAKIAGRIGTLPLQKYLPLSLAEEAAKAAVAYCKSIGSGAAAVVADRSGKPKVWLDADEGRAANADVARRKAYTAVVKRENTAALAKQMERLPQGRATRLSDPNLIGASGGLPFIVDGDVVGAIGVSGGSRDPDCAQAGLEKIKDRLR